MPTQKPAALKAALVSLIILQTLMRMALFTQTAPHPPLRVAPFAIAPFLAVTLAACASALILEAHRRAGLGMGLSRPCCP